MLITLRINEYSLLFYELQIYFENKNIVIAFTVQVRTLKKIYGENSLTNVHIYLLTLSPTTRKNLGVRHG